MPRPVHVVIAVVTVLVGCTPAPNSHIVAALDADMPTVVHVSWTSADPGAGYADFGPDASSYAFTTPAEGSATTSHAVTLYGLPAETECHFRVVTGTAASDDHVVTTGSLPSGVPSFEPLIPFTDPQAGPFLLTSTVDLSEDHSAAVVLDANGSPVWYTKAAAGITSARLSADGTGVYFIQNFVDDRAANGLVIVGFDGTRREIAVPDAHHDVIEGPAGGYVTFVTTYRDIDGTTVAGDQLVEVAEDGSQRVVWDAFDNLEVVENAGFEATQLDGADWTHANGLVYDADDDSYVISLYFTEQVVKVDRATGDTVWILGGLGSDFTFADDDAFGPQHAPELTDDGLLLFDNRGISDGSRLVAYSLDAAAGTATNTWSWAYPGGAWTPVLGDVHRFADGSALGSWGLSGHVTLADPDGELVGDLLVGDTLTVGQVAVMSGFYPAE